MRAEMQTTQSMLIHHYSQKSLAHFYIIKPSPKDDGDATTILERWKNNFLEEILLQSNFVKTKKAAREKLKFGMMDILEVKKKC